MLLGENVVLGHTLGSKRLVLGLALSRKRLILGRKRLVLGLALSRKRLVLGRKRLVLGLALSCKRLVLGLALSRKRSLLVGDLFALLTQLSLQQVLDSCARTQQLRTLHAFLSREYSHFASDIILSSANSRTLAGCRVKRVHRLHRRCARVRKSATARRVQQRATRTTFALACCEACCEACSSRGDTALHVAARLGFLECA